MLLSSSDAKQPSQNAFPIWEGGKRSLTEGWEVAGKALTKVALSPSLFKRRIKDELKQQGVEQMALTKEKKDEIRRLNFEDAVNIINSVSDYAEFSGPVSEELIQKAESILGVKFPPSYRRFLKEFGGV